jgi:hypothetical protein
MDVPRGEAGQHGQPAAHVVAVRVEAARLATLVDEGAEVVGV